MPHFACRNLWFWRAKQGVLHLCSSASSAVEILRKKLKKKWKIFAEMFGGMQEFLYLCIKREDERRKDCIQDDKGLDSGFERAGTFLVREW